MFGTDRPFDSQRKSTHDVLFASRHCSSILIAHMHGAWFRPSFICAWLAAAHPGDHGDDSRFGCCDWCQLTI